jgi:hypothetical protein
MLEPHGRNPEDHAHQGGNDPRTKNRNDKREAQSRRQYGCRIGADPEESTMAERDLAGESDENVQAYGSDSSDTNEID